MQGYEGLSDKEGRSRFGESVLKHVSENFSYPKQARALGIEGRVYIRFVVEKDASLSSLRL